MTDDAELLHAFCDSRSETAFALLVHRHLGLVYHAAARQLGDERHLASDVTQMVFLLLAARAHSLKHHPSLAGWLYSTTHFKVSAVLRSERRRRAREQAVAAVHATVTPAAVPNHERDQIHALLDQSLLALSEQDREAILLRFFEDQAYSDIAARTALSEGAAHKRVERALERLRAQLGRRGVTSGAEALAAILGAQSGLGVPADLAIQITAAAMASPVPAAVGILQLMTASKLTLSVAALAAILAVGISVYEPAESGRSADALARSRRENADLAAQFRQLGAQISAAQTNPASKLLAQPKDNSLALAGSRGVAGAEERSGNKLQAKSKLSSAALSADPQIHAGLKQLVDWNNANYFGPLLKAAGLSPAQIERGEHLIGQEAAFAGLAPDPLFFTDSQTAKSVDAELQATIGDAGRAAVNTYLLKRLVTDQLAGTLYDSGSPLTATQSSQLMQTLVSNNPAPTGSGWYPPQLTDWNAALASAAQFLSPPQLAQLKNLAIARFGLNSP